MTDKNIQEAVNEVKAICKLDERDDSPLTPYGEGLRTLLDLATRYLSVGCPEKKEIGEMRYGGCNPDEDRGYNQALDDYRLWMMKRLEGITPEKLHQWYLDATYAMNKTFYNPNAQKLYKDLTSEQQSIDKFIANAIRNHLTEER